MYDELEMVKQMIEIKDKLKRAYETHLILAFMLAGSTILSLHSSYQVEKTSREYDKLVETTLDLKNEIKLLNTQLRHEEIKIDKNNHDSSLFAD